MFITAAIFIALVTLTSGHKLPQDDFLQDPNTVKLLKILGRLMSIIDDHDITEIEQDQTQVIRCLDELTLDHLQELLESLLGNSTNTYVITSDGDVFLGTNELSVYLELSILPTLRNATNLWVSKPPCNECITILDVMFGTFAKPKLHIESLKFDSNITSTMKLLVKLKNLGFDFVAWDWEKFLSDIGTKDEQCNQIINTTTSDSVYSTMKFKIQMFLKMFDFPCNATSGPQISGPQISGPQISGPQISGPQISGPQISGPQISGPQISGS